MTLAELPRRQRAIVDAVVDAMPNDAIARRLRELGFVAGEEVQVMTTGPFGAEPLLVQVGYTRFALRRREAERVRLRVANAALPAASVDAGVDTPVARDAVAVAEVTGA